MKNKIKVGSKNTHMRVSEVFRKILKVEGEGPEYNVTVYRSRTGKTFLVEVVCKDTDRKQSVPFRGKYALMDMGKYLKDYNLKLVSHGPEEFSLVPDVYCPFKDAADRIDRLAHDMCVILPKERADDLQSVLNNLAVDLRDEGEDVG